MSPTSTPCLDLTVEAPQGRGDQCLHLTLGRSHRSLCGRPTSAERASRRFRQDGCPQCLDAALRSGQIVAQEGRRSWINLSRI